VRAVFHTVEQLRAAAQRRLPRFASDFMDGGSGSELALRRNRRALRRLGEIRARWPRRLVVKGLLHPEDAGQAKALGVDGIIVSNHGGGQPESAPAPLLALHGIRTAVSDDMPVLLDDGIRSGEDIAKALALGADLVLLGRAFLYRVAVSDRTGERGRPFGSLVMNSTGPRLSWAAGTIGNSGKCRLGPMKTTGRARRKR
jgi:isopentenyl diphosphate isomerase/L-lactate dehydrogenase-like FMN-dependent dehydrogenase